MLRRIDEKVLPIVSARRSGRPIDPEAAPNEVSARDGAEVAGLFRSMGAKREER